MVAEEDASGIDAMRYSNMVLLIVLPRSLFLIVLAKARERRRNDDAK